MKKYVLLVITVLTVLAALNGCALKAKDKDKLKDEREAFAAGETEKAGVDGENENTSYVGLPHKFTVETDSGKLVASDGTLLATYSYSYPVFECNEGDDEKVIAAINKMFEDNASELVDEAINNEGSLAELYEFSVENDFWFLPYDYKYNYEIHTDAKGIISFTEAVYRFWGGAHGGTVKTSYNFDVVNGRKLSLSDLLYGTEEEITSAFTQAFMEVKEEFFGDPSEIVPKEFPTAQYYVDAEGVTAYFQQYQVGSYAAGFVSATISDKEMLKIDISDVNEN